jgi:hypothetical protein
MWGRAPRFSWSRSRRRTRTRRPTRTAGNAHSGQRTRNYPVANRLLIELERLGDLGDRAVRWCQGGRVQRLSGQGAPAAISLSSSRAPWLSAGFSHSIARHRTSASECCSRRQVLRVSPLVGDVASVGEGAGEPIELGHDEGVALAAGRERFA